MPDSDSYDSDEDTSDTDSSDGEDYEEREPTAATAERTKHEMGEWLSLNHGLATYSMAVVFGDLLLDVYPDQRPGKMGKKKIRQGKARLRNKSIVLKHEIPYLQYLSAPIEPLPERYAALDYIAGERTRMMVVKSIEALAAAALSHFAEMAARPSFVSLGRFGIRFDFEFDSDNCDRKSCPDGEEFLYRAIADVSYQVVM